MAELFNLITMLTCYGLAMVAWERHDKAAESERDQYAWFALGCTVLFVIMLVVYFTHEG